MADTFTIRGLDGILDNLRKLPDRVANNAARRSLRKGANVIRDAARNNAKRVDDPSTPRAIWKNIVVSGGGKKREQKAGGPMMRVGVLGGAKKYVGNKKNVRKGKAGKSYAVGGSSDNPGGDTWYWRFLEFGTSKSPAHPILQPAASSKAQAAFDAIAIDLPKQIDKELAKLK